MPSKKAFGTRNILCSFHKALVIVYGLLLVFFLGYIYFFITSLHISSWWFYIFAFKWSLHKVSQNYFIEQWQLRKDHTQWDIHHHHYGWTKASEWPPYDGKRVNFCRKWDDLSSLCLQKYYIQGAIEGEVSRCTPRKSNKGF